MVVLVGGVWLLAIPYSPYPILETGTVIDLYREMGIVPEAGAITFSKEIEHDVFEVPERDGVELKKAMASMSMGGMDMGGMKMDGGADQAMPGIKMDGMKMDGNADHAKEGMAMEEEAGHGGGSAAEGLMILAQGTASAVDEEIGHDGIIVDSSAVIDLKEWSVGSGMTMVQPGKSVRLTVRNSGNIPHEFMIMNGAAMEAVNYRLNRPDWNLLEHEATMEVPFLMPGDTVDMIVKITKPGIWMYMCMFPYHMQLGMMGMLMTPDKMGSMNMNMEMDMFLPKM